MPFPLEELEVTVQGDYDGGVEATMWKWMD